MTDRPSTMLSKSKVIAGQQCARRLWFQCHHPELAPPTDPTMQAIFDAGTDVGRRAHELFPGGVLVDDWDFARAVDRTAALMSNADVPAIFEAAFVHDGVRIRVDVLERLGDEVWGLREVKSTSDVKDVHLDDVAVQQYVLEGCRLRITSAELIHINTRYTRGVGPIDWRLFFSRADLTAVARERQASVAALVAEMQRTLLLPDAPTIAPSSHCGTPYGCEFWDHCTRDKPEDWIYRLPRVRTARKEALMAEGVERIADIPDDVELGAIPDRIRDVVRSGRPFVSPDLGPALAGFGPPAFYLDFETTNPAIPLYPLTRPYERIPFQWSVHRVGTGGRLSHQEFLADGRTDPRRELAEKLLAALGETVEPILVYSSFESSVLNDLAWTLPDLASPLQEVRARLRDLLQLVREHVYDPGFRVLVLAKERRPGFGAWLRLRRPRRYCGRRCCLKRVPAARRGRGARGRSGAVASGAAGVLRARYARVGRTPPGTSCTQGFPPLSHLECGVTTAAWRRRHR